MRKLLIDIPRTQVHCKQGSRVNITFKDCLGNKSIIKQKRIESLSALFLSLPVEEKCYGKRIYSPAERLESGCYRQSRSISKNSLSTPRIHSCLRWHISGSGHFAEPLAHQRGDFIYT